MDTQQALLAILIVLVVVLAAAFAVGAAAGASLTPKKCADPSQCPEGYPFCINGVCAQCTAAADCPPWKGYSCKMCLGGSCVYNDSSPCGL